MVKITKADAPTVQMDATLFRQLVHPPTLDAVPATMLPIYSGSEQAQSNQATEYAGLHTQWLGSLSGKKQSKYHICMHCTD